MQRSGFTKVSHNLPFHNLCHGVIYSTNYLRQGLALEFRSLQCLVQNIRFDF